VKVEGSKMTFDFTAKSGKRRVQVIDDARLARVVRALKERDDGNRELLAYEEDGRWHDIRSSDINGYLHELAGDDFTAKDFRTWQATVLAATFLASAEIEGVGSRRRAVTGVIKEVAEHLGNTPAVCRTSYIDPRVVDRFLEGVTIAGVVRKVDVERLDIAARERIERAVLQLVQGSSHAKAA
jgi:DNA topoisomerase IB